MKIATKLKLSALVPALMAVVIGLALLFSNRAIEKAQEEGSSARRIMESMNELNNFARHYMLYHEERAKLQFLIEHDTITRHLAAIEFTDDHKQRILESIRHNSKAMREAFLKLVSNFERYGSVQDSALLMEAEERLAGRILVRSSDVLSHVLQLERLIGEEIATTQRRVSALIFALIFCTTLPFTILLIRMMGNITTSLKTLRQGTEVIAAGNLNHRLSIAAQDEIGELSGAFNLMTQQLCETTVSRDELSREVEERKHAEEELRRNREWFRVTLNSIGDAVIATDASGLVTFLNPIGVKLTGWKLEEALGEPIQSVFQIINEIDRQPSANVVERVLREGCIVNLANHTALVTADGREIPIEDSAAPIRDSAGNLIGVVLVFHDVTEKRRAQETLRKAHDELEWRVRERTAALSTTVARLELMNEELQEFAHVASHDLQEPLRKIQTFCDMAKKRCAPALDSTGQEYLERVLNSAARMRQLLDDLLQFSRVATRPEPFKEIDLGEIARESADIFEAEVRTAGSLVEIENMPTIEADETQMLRLFQNLIGNALKFSRNETSRIRVYARNDGAGSCEIFVKDNGIGFEQQFAERIFKPFQRLHNRKEYEGTGMGLAICRKIADRHGGSIRAESEPGKGATFIIRLPLRQDRWEGI
jgi:PAS domain S-box-containing protein